MNKATPRNRGFTLVELLIVIIVISVLATIGVVAYQNTQKRAAHATVFKDLKSASEQLGLSYVKSPTAFSSLDTIAGDMQTSGDIVLRLVKGYTGPYYENLSPVQNGVLFYDICKELIDDPAYSTIHSHDGSQTHNVIMGCDSNVGDTVLLITGWDSKSWNTPVTRQDILNYINSVPYDSWFTDKQDVVRGFYGQMIQRFEARGGEFPIESFFEPDANEWWGVPKEDLPAPSPPASNMDGSFCAEAYHTTLPDDIYNITDDDVIKAGPC